MFGRKQPQTHRQQLMDELNESYTHLRLAAGHAAGGAAETITPAYDRARTVATRGLQSTRGAFEPLYVQVRNGATKARMRRRPAKQEEKHYRGSALFGLIAAGAAVGAAGVIVVRRRKAATQWEDYEPLSELETSYGVSEAERMSTSGGKVGEPAATTAESMAKKATDAMGAMTGTTGETAAGAAEKPAGMAERPSAMGDRPAGMAEKPAGMAEKPSSAADKAQPTSNVRDKSV